MNSQIQGVKSEMETHLVWEVNTSGKGEDIRKWVWRVNMVKIFCTDV
jgi:hypothetical protein